MRGLQTTLTTFDEALCRIARAQCVHHSRAREQILKECRRRGIPTVVWLSPILPYINDTEENVNGLLDYCIETGVHGVVCFRHGR